MKKILFAVIASFILMDCAAPHLQQKFKKQSKIENIESPIGHLNTDTTQYDYLLRSMSDSLKSKNNH